MADQIINAIKDNPNPERIYQINIGQQIAPNIFDGRISPQQFFNWLDQFKLTTTDYGFKYYHSQYYYYYWQDRTLLYDNQGRSKVYRRLIDQVQTTPRAQLVVWQKLTIPDLGCQQDYQRVEKIHKFFFANQKFKVSFEIIVPAQDQTTKEALLSHTSSNEIEPVYQVRIQVLDPQADLAPLLSFFL